MFGVPTALTNETNRPEMKFARSTLRGTVAVGLLSATAMAAVPHTIETIQISAGRGQAPYRLEVEGQWAGNEMDDARHLAIFSVGGRTIVSVEGGLATTRDSIDPDVLARNALHSKFIFSAPPMPSNMVVVFGHTFDTGPAEMRIIRLGPIPEQILSEEEFYFDHARTGADGRSLLVIGKRTVSEMATKCLLTYDPYAVFELKDVAKGRFRYSLDLSKKYNLAHYFGWAGPKSGNGFVVNICRKPAPIVRL